MRRQKLGAAAVVQCSSEAAAGGGHETGGAAAATIHQSVAPATAEQTADSRDNAVMPADTRCEAPCHAAGHLLAHHQQQMFKPPAWMEPDPGRVQEWVVTVSSLLRSSRILSPLRVVHSAVHQVKLFCCWPDACHQRLSGRSPLADSQLRGRRVDRVLDRRLHLAVRDELRNDLETKVRGEAG